jgi:hypothetical protein
VNGSGLRPGTPTKCGRCLSPDLELHEDGTAYCRACGSVTAPAWMASLATQPTARDLAPPRPPTYVEVLVHNPSFLIAAGHRAEWERRIGRWTAAASFVALLSLVAFPFVIGIFMGPIIHLSNPHIQYVGSSGGVCSLNQVFTLANSGNRAGIAFVVLYIDHQPTFFWNVTVPAFKTMTVDEPVSVANCQSRSYGIGFRVSAA